MNGHLNRLEDQTPEEIELKEVFFRQVLSYFVNMDLNLDQKQFMT